MRAEKTWMGSIVGRGVNLFFVLDVSQISVGAANPILARRRENVVGDNVCHRGRGMNDVGWDEEDLVRANQNRLALDLKLPGPLDDKSQLLVRVRMRRHETAFRTFHPRDHQRAVPRELAEKFFVDSFRGDFVPTQFLALPT